MNAGTTLTISATFSATPTTPVYTVTGKLTDQALTLDSGLTYTAQIETQDAGVFWDAGIYKGLVEATVSGSPVVECFDFILTGC